MLQRKALRHCRLSWKVNRRKKLAEKIKRSAFFFGDLLPRTANMTKKNDQAILEARIADLEVMVSNARVIGRKTLRRIPCTSVLPYL